MRRKQMNSFNRRSFLQAIAAAGSASILSIPQARAGVSTKARVAVVGGGFGGAAAAKYIKMMDPAIEVTLIEPNRVYTACPLSNEVISGHRTLESLQTNYSGLQRRGVHVLNDSVAKVDAVKKMLTLKTGATLPYDALVMAPGIEFKWGSVEGYSEAVANDIPHAYKAGPQTLLLQKQVMSMKDGDVCIIAPPPKPFRCPPGPYERAAQIAHYLKHHGKGKSKVLILDPNDSFSKKGLFEQAWQTLYPGMITWVPGKDDGKVVRIDPKTRDCFTTFGEHKGASVVNIIPAHTAGRIAIDTGLTNAGGWCEVKPSTMESTVYADIYPVGDACIAGELPVYDMPKSAHMAVTQAKVAAGAIVAKINGLPAPVPFYVNTCYSLAAPNYGFSVVHVFKVEDNKFIYVKAAGGTSPLKTPDITRRMEAEYATGWFNNIMADSFA
jgi:sulfide dehydrogenase [flavocytochrome c] flavoprotein subunit